MEPQIMTDCVSQISSQYVWLKDIDVYRNAYCFSCTDGTNCSNCWTTIIKSLSTEKNIQVLEYTLEELKRILVVARQTKFMLIDIQV